VGDTAGFPSGSLRVNSDPALQDDERQGQEVNSCPTGTGAGKGWADGSTGRTAPRTLKDPSAGSGQALGVLNGQCAPTGGPIGEGSQEMAKRMVLA